MSTKTILKCLGLAFILAAFPLGAFAAEAADPLTPPSAYGSATQEAEIIDMQRRQDNHMRMQDGRMRMNQEHIRNNDPAGTYDQRMRMNDERTRMHDDRMRMQNDMKR